MYFSLIITFLLILGLVVVSIQNRAPLEIEFISWKFEMSLTALIFYSSMLGAAIVAVLTLPKLVSKSLRVRHLRREVHELRKRTVDLESENKEG